MKKILLISFLLLSSLIFGKGFEKGTYSDAKSIKTVGVTEPYSQKIEVFKDEVRLYLSNSGEPSFFGMPTGVIRCFDDNCDCSEDVKLNNPVIYNSYYDCYIIKANDEFINSLKKHNEVFIEIKYSNKNDQLKYASGRFYCKNFTKLYEWLMKD